MASEAVLLLIQHDEQTSVTQHESIIKQALTEAQTQLNQSNLTLAMLVQKLPLRLRYHPGSLIWAAIKAGTCTSQSSRLLESRGLACQFVASCAASHQVYDCPLC